MNFNGTKILGKLKILKCVQKTNYTGQKYNKINTKIKVNIR